MKAIKCINLDMPKCTHEHENANTCGICIRAFAEAADDDICESCKIILKRFGIPFPLLSEEDLRTAQGYPEITDDLATEIKKMCNPAQDTP